MTLRALKKEPGRTWEAVEIESSLEALQEAVGGYIESVILASDVCILCDEERRLKGRPYNTTIGNASFVGTILLVGMAQGEFTGLTEEQVECLRDMGVI